MPGLRELSLADNSFSGLPPALSTATALEHLDLGHTEDFDGDAAEILANLPCLRKLCISWPLWHMPDPEVWRRLPHVQHALSIEFEDERHVG